MKEVISCKDCEHLCTDADRFGWWFICGHSVFGDEGKGFSDKDLSMIPEWCPLNKKERKESSDERE